MFHLLKLLFDLFRRDQMHRALQGASTGDACVACDGDDVTLLADAAYRCNACGHEGGDGYAAYQRDQARARVALLTDDERRRRAATRLADARRLLLGAQGTMKAAKGWSRLDMAGLGGIASIGAAGEGGQRKQRDLLAVLSEMLLAKENIDAATHLIYGDDAPSEFTFDAEIGHAWASVDLYLDNILVDLAFHSKIRRVAQDLKRLDEHAQRIQVLACGAAAAGA